MYNPKTYEYDCTRSCRLRAHGDAITSALTKRSISDQKLAAYVAKTCSNYSDNVDNSGRSAVHMAASVGRYDILEWLLNQGSIISSCDFESGRTPLHCAIFYGCIDCAVLLLRYGASIDILDKDGFSPLQQACRPCDYIEKQAITLNNELLVWGTNKNYNLGINKDHGVDSPQMLDYFYRKQISIQAVALGLFHSLFFDDNYNLYAVGHGKGGRLGTGNENSLSIPQKVNIHLNKGETIVSISVSRTHSMVLTNSAVFVCGINNSQQLGIKDIGEMCLNFKKIPYFCYSKTEGLEKVIALDCYSLAYSEQALYVWGANVGQMGIDISTKVVESPVMMKLPPQTCIKCVEASKTAIAVLTNKNKILLYCNYKIKVIRAPYFQDVKSITIVDKSPVSALKLLIITGSNVVFLWYQLSQNFYWCSFSNIQLTTIDKILYKSNKVLILSKGDVYKGKSHQVLIPSCDENNELFKRRKSSENVWSSESHQSVQISEKFMIRIDLQRITDIDRAVDVFCDDDFDAFAVLQESHVKYFKVPALNSEEYTFKKLYNDVCEDDTIHDVVFHVDGDKFPAHKLIIHAQAPGLTEIIAENEERDVYLDFELLTSKMFEMILKFIYFNYLPNQQDLEDMQSSLDPYKPPKLQKVCVIFLEFVKQFQIKSLAKYLKYFAEKEEEDFYLSHMDDIKCRLNRLRHSDFPQLYDVCILCENNVEIPAHKCVLVARSEYFETMFRHTSAERTAIHLTTIPFEYMSEIIKYLYSLDATHFHKKQYQEAFFYNMIVFCDQFLMEHLKKVCEVLLLDKISIRKCGEMLDFAHIYNCELLKEGCMDYICQNLSRVFLKGSIFNCDPESLKCINQHYRKMFKKVYDYRIITPDSKAVDDACLHSFVEDFQVDLSYRMDEEEELLNREIQKTKANEGKIKLSSRQYEKEAISSMMETLNVSGQSEKIQRSSDKSETTAETVSEEISNKLQNGVDTWKEVVGKKELKKKVSVDQVLKGNEDLRLKVSPSHSNVVLNKTNGPTVAVKDKSPEMNLDVVSSTSSASILYNINLTDLTTPPRGKLSQKQRKRLISESSNVNDDNCHASAVVKSEPVAEPQTPNAWGITPPTPPLLNIEFDLSATGSSADSSSFANMIRGTLKTSSSSSPTSSSTTANNTFSQILAEEKRQRKFYERSKHKSLALTQIEEQAIIQLKEFYNVDNVADEIITVQRKSEPSTINFAIWQRN